jgi:hypothetical protein
MQLTVSSTYLRTINLKLLSYTVHENEEICISRDSFEMGNINSMQMFNVRTNLHTISLIISQQLPLRMTAHS